MDAHSRRRAALDAIDAVLKGARANDVETEVVDFKEEAGTIDRTGERQAIPVEHEPSARALAEEAACFANGEHGGVLVVGVDDDASGPRAFVGTHLDTGWLRSRIHALTQPNLALDVIEVREAAGARIYLINVAPALEEVRCGGKLRVRFEAGCEELTGNRAAEFLEHRRKYDWSAERSGMRLSQATPDSLASARARYREAHGTVPRSDLELARRLEVLVDDRDDPELSHAGALLLCEFEPRVDQIGVLLTVAEGTASRERLTLKAPLLPAFDSTWAKLETEFPATEAIVGAQRRAVRPIPEQALREAFINAIAHRDYRHPRNLILAIITGDPASALKVSSPGGFPPGVLGNRLLATRSHPRNPALANALRVLGLAEREGVGISTMFRVMLRDGHPEPEVLQSDGEVICRLTGGAVDADVRQFFDDVEVRDPQLGQSVRTHIAITALLSQTPLRTERLSELAQCTRGEAAEVLQGLVSAGAIERLLNRSASFRLTHETRRALQNRISYATRGSIDEKADLVRAYLDVNDVIGREDAAKLLGVQPNAASRILSTLYNERGIIEPVGAARGRGVRYRLPQ